MTFVHGHPRDAGWVKSHFRRPRRAGQEQLDLDGAAVPAPRGAPEDQGTEDTADHTGAADDQDGPADLPAP